MFEITGNDINALNDTDLRTLIGLLCEADLRRANLPVSAVTWGGNQTAKDGGLDVRVSLPPGTQVQGFIPRAETGFQVKKPDMQPAAIDKEVKPKGRVRPVINQLAALSGAYVIVSSSGSTADSSLTGRRNAMAKATKGVKGAKDLHLDFYDRGRIATWVRDHPGLIPWVRGKIGKAVLGWRAYGEWSHTPANTDKSYLLDEETRIKTARKEDGAGLTAVDGINRMRDLLQQPGQMVRLVGLSGVGKTRLVQALFESDIGANVLDRSLAIYTDTTDEPEPQPRELASDLIAARTRAILVIDNCPAATHRRLSEVVLSEGSTISVITIEYDIRDDQPEGTDVLSLDLSSLAVVEKLVANRYPSFSQINARTIAEFSGGNARIALALANTVKNTETVAGLSDADLFTRLFEQRHGHDASMLVIAQACSLVYSFQGEALSGDGAELPVLGNLIEKSAQDVFRGVAELKRRDLLQQRREWRAVLPHAIANRLAALALQNIPYASIEASIVHGQSPRLLQSFSRRLGYLDGSTEAQDIVRNWLGPSGVLSDILNLNEPGIAIFNNIAPVLPDATLAAIENALASADKETLARNRHFIRLLRSLAYEPALFERAVAALTKFIIVDEDNKVDDDASKMIASLFYIALSGTHAPLSLRLKVVNAFLSSQELAQQNLGVEVLGAMMKSDNFSSNYGFEFGARSRDYGYYPRTGEEVGAWFDEALKLADPLVGSTGAVAEKMKQMFIRRFRGLWTNGGRFDAIERICRSVAGTDFWREGWITAKETLRYDGKGLRPEALQRLIALEGFLRPKNLVNRVRGLTLGEKAASFDFDELDDDHRDYSKAMERATAAIEDLGRDVAVDDKAFGMVLPELISGSGQLGYFGRGLALGAELPSEMWKSLVGQVASTENPNVQLLCGFLAGLQIRDAAEAQAFLDQALEDKTLAEWVPELQASVPLDTAGVGRLRRALELGNAPIRRFMVLVYGGVCEPIPGPTFRDLMLAIGARPDGNIVALEILAMRLHNDGAAKRAPLAETVEAGRRLLDKHSFASRSSRADHDDYRMGVVAMACLIGPEGAPVARKVWRRLKRAIRQRNAYAGDYDDLLRGLCKAQPEPLLDELVSGNDRERQRSVEILHDAMRHRENPLSVITDDVIVRWCDGDPKIRYPFAAATVPLFARPRDGEPHEWKPIAELLLHRSPDPAAVFKEIAVRLRPRSFSGSVATKFEFRLNLLDRLKIESSPAIRSAFSEARAELAARVAKARRSETEEGKAESGRFE